jgi:hypothetical protein
VLRIFIALKNPAPWPGSNPQLLGPVANTLSTTPPKGHETRNSPTSIRQLLRVLLTHLSLLWQHSVVAGSALSGTLCIKPKLRLHDCTVLCSVKVKAILIFFLNAVSSFFYFLLFSSSFRTESTDLHHK